MEVSIPNSIEAQIAMERIAALVAGDVSVVKVLSADACYRRVEVSGHDSSYDQFVAGAAEGMIALSKCENPARYPREVAK